MKNKKILVTGGAGYIGSHTLISLDSIGYEFIVFDNLSNASKESIRRVEKIINKKVNLIIGDIRNEDELKKIFMDYNIDSVIHFAGLKAVGESVENPVRYYDNNVNGTITLLKVMKKFNCKKIVFSSSATVYNEMDSCCLDETSLVGNTSNPYGTSKYIIERILNDLYISDCSFKIIILRYFNPVGAHESGFIGENPNGIPNNLMPYISQVAVKKRDFLNVFGNDYNTSDGTGIRDYIHVVDLSDAHVKAIEYIYKYEKFKPLTLNVGTGQGYSVFEMIKAFEKASGMNIPYKIVKRRKGDISSYYANVELIKNTLKWEAKKRIDDMCEDTWNWQRKNPNGYEE